MIPASHRNQVRFIAALLGLCRLLWLMLPSLIVLAGGESRRMGRPKALLPVPGHEVPLLAYVVDRVRKGTPLDRIVLVANEPAVAQALPPAADVTVVQDAIPGQGPLRGLATGLLHVPDWAFVLGCDMPFVNPAVLRYLLACREVPGSVPQAIIPVIQAKAQTLHALYHVSCRPAVVDALRLGERRMTAMWPAIRLHTVSEAELDHLDPHGASFSNLNTPADWEAARIRLLQAGEPV